MAEADGQQDAAPVGPEPPPYVEAGPRTVRHRHRPHRAGHRRRRHIAILVTTLLIVTTSWLLVGVVLRELWRLQKSEAVRTRNHVGEHRERVIATLGVTPDDTRRTWGALTSLLEQADLLSDRIQSELIDQGFEPRHEYDEGELDYDYVLQSPQMPAGVDRERRAISRLRAEGVFARLAEIAREAPGLRPAVLGEEPIILAYPPPPELGQARTLARARVASMRLALERGDLEEVTAAFDETMALGRTLSHQVPILSYLVAISVQGHAMSELLSELTEGDFDEPALERLEATLERQRIAPLRLALAGEHACFHEFVQSAFTDDGGGDGYILPALAADMDEYGLGTAASTTIIDAFRARYLLATRRETLRCYDEMIEIFQAIAERPPVDRSQAAMHAWLEGLDERLMLVEIVAPALHQVVDGAATTELHVAGLRLALALERYRIRNGSLPPSLDALVPQCLDEPVLDPLHGEPFRYRPPGPDDGRRYVLYSTGVDGHDDGGLEDEYDPRRALQGQSPGVDFLITRPRKEPED